MEKKWQTFSLGFSDKTNKNDNFPIEAFDTLAKICALGDNIVRDFKTLKEREVMVDLIHDILFDIVRFDEVSTNLSYNMEPKVK